MLNPSIKNIITMTVNQTNKQINAFNQTCMCGVCDTPPLFALIETFWMVCKNSIHISCNEVSIKLLFNYKQPKYP